jgi:hypothetical protein
VVCIVKCATLGIVPYRNPRRRSFGATMAHMAAKSLHHHSFGSSLAERMGCAITSTTFRWKRHGSLSSELPRDQPPTHADRGRPSPNRRRRRRPDEGHLWRPPSGMTREGCRRRSQTHRNNRPNAWSHSRPATPGCAWEPVIRSKSLARLSRFMAFPGPILRVDREPARRRLRTRL